MPSRPSVKSAFENLRPTIMREPSRSAVSAEAEARLLDKPSEQNSAVMESTVLQISEPTRQQDRVLSESTTFATPFTGGSLLQKKRRDRLLLVSFRMPQGLKERLEQAAKRHELNQTDIINEAIELNLQRYL